MKERIKSVRKSLKLTQQQFADELHITKSTVGAYEYGQVVPSDRTINDICRLFNINEEWLRTGEGEMFTPMTRDQEIADLCADIISRYNNIGEDFKIRLIKCIAKVPEDKLDYLQEMINYLANGGEI